MKKLIAMLLALCLILGMAACGAAPAEPAPADKPDAPVADKVDDTKKEDPAPAAPRTLVVGMEKEPATLNACTSSENIVLQVGHLYHGMLTSLNAENGGAIQPAIASSWEYLSNKELVLHLRDDVYFHNGRKLTADDIVFTFNWHLNPDNGSIRYNNYSGKLDKVEKIDEYTVKLTMLSPDPALLELLTYLPIVAEDTVDTLDTAPIGCGPFKFVKWEANNGIEFETFDQYYDAGSIQFDKLYLRCFQDYNAALTAFFAGEVDIFLWLKTTDIPAVTSRPGFYAQTIDDAAYYLGSNIAYEPLANEKVREAIMYAIDKDQLISLLFNGVGSPISQVVPPTNQFYNTELDWEQDIERAKQALIDAGYPNGLDLEISCTNQQIRVDMATVLKEQLEKVGFRITVKGMESADFFTYWRAGESQLAIGNFGFYADPSFRSTFVSSQYNNNWRIYGYDNAEYNDLYTQGMNETDTAARKEIYTKMWTKMRDEVGFFMLLAATNNAAVKDNIEGFIYRGSGNSDFTKITFKD